MSQQTQIDRVIPKWLDFLDRYPTPSTLAAAPLGDVITIWVGLGYNRRARMLHDCAGAIVQRHDGLVPNDLAELLALPGIGPYTARAVLAFAFERDVAVVDTNVGRILARIGGLTLRPSDAQRLADDVVPTGRGWEWNQGLLDFGAMLCTKRNPKCGDCPVRSHCQWRNSGPDPALGSAGVSTPQSTFAGSDREGRGRLIRRLAEGPVPADEVALVMGWVDDPPRSERVLEGLIADGLVLRKGSLIRFP